MATRAAWAAAAKYWTIPPSSTLIPDSEVERLAKDKQHAYLVLVLVFSEESLHLYRVGKLERESPRAAGAAVSASLRPRNLNLAPPLPDNMREAAKQPLYTYPTDRWCQLYHPSGLITTVQQLQAYVQLRAQGKADGAVEQLIEARVVHSAPLLQAKTLLLDREQLSAKLPEAAIAAAYPFPFLVTDRATIEAAVAASDPRYLYLHYLAVSDAGSLTTGVKPAFQLIDIANGQAISYADFRFKGETLAGQVQDKLLKALVKKAQGGR